MTDVKMLEITTPLGHVRLLSRGSAQQEELIGAYLLTPEATYEAPLGAPANSPLLARAATQLAEYFAGTRTDFDLSLGADGTDFQHRVWRTLTKIPFGETWSYGQLAKKLGDPNLSRAVGAANGKNPLWIIVPCHRVIGADGSLTGYAGGISAKKWLLAHEQRQQTLRPT